MESKLVRIVFLTDEGMIDKEHEVIWDIRFPLPPEGTRVISFSKPDRLNYHKLVAKDGCGDLHYLRRGEDKYFWERI